MDASRVTAPLKVAFFSVVPSPYQRDLFAALAARPEIALDVFYLERASPDSPWPEKPLAAYEHILPGFWFSLGSARCHVNWSLPDASAYDVVVLNTLMSLTAQRLMRLDLRTKSWLFWGERLTNRARWHAALCAPLARSNGIVSIGTLALRDYQARFPSVAHFNIPYHCDLTAFQTAPRKERTDDNVTFLLCGQMIRRKGVDLVLEAFRRLGPRAHLLLVGREGELPELLAPIPEEVRSRIHYAGFQAPDALPRFFAQADVFLLPSRHDGWGVVVNQALGAGLPILCSDAVGAAYDLIIPEENGLRFAADSIDAAAKAMQRMIAEPELIPRSGAKSRELATAWQPAEGAQKW
ncbi:MAG: glycosyltransferase family 4 protein, partial [Chthoniobacteraceae bacterium]